MSAEATGVPSNMQALGVKAVFGAYALSLQNEASMNRFMGQLQESESMMDQSTQAFIAGEMAILSAQNQSNSLKMDFNKRQAYNAVEVAKQGRSFSSGSVQAIMQGDVANLQYDTEFAKAIGQYKESAYKRQSENYYKGAIENIAQAKDAHSAAVGGAFASFVGSFL